MPTGLVYICSRRQQSEQHRKKRKEQDLRYTVGDMGVKGYKCSLWVSLKEDLNMKILHAEFEVCKTVLITCKPLVAFPTPRNQNTPFHRD
jgi:hypothetical protein